jgi:hypothetical protein
LIAATIFWLSALLSLNIGIRSPPDDGCKSSLRLGHGDIVVSVVQRCT